MYGTPRLSYHSIILYHDVLLTLCDVVLSLCGVLLSLCDVLLSLCGVLLSSCDMQNATLFMINMVDSIKSHGKIIGCNATV